jgi:hypothetical protein
MCGTLQANKVIIIGRQIQKMDCFICETAQRFALPALGRAAGRRPTGKMLRRRKMPGIAPESPASGARFVGRCFIQNTPRLFRPFLHPDSNLNDHLM